MEILFVHYILKKTLEVIGNQSMSRKIWLLKSLKNLGCFFCFHVFLELFLGTNDSNTAASIKHAIPYLRAIFVYFLMLSVVTCS